MCERTAHPTGMRDAAARLVERTTAEQGLPERVADPQTLATIAAIIGTADRRRDAGARAA